MLNESYLEGQPQYSTSSLKIPSSGENSVSSALA